MKVKFDRSHSSEPLTIQTKNVIGDLAGDFLEGNYSHKEASLLAILTLNLISDKKAYGLQILDGKKLSEVKLFQSLQVSWTSIPSEND